MRLLFRPRWRSLGLFVTSAGNADDNCITRAKAMFVAKKKLQKPEEINCDPHIVPHFVLTRLIGRRSRSGVVDKTKNGSSTLIDANLNT
jgi:hypothetical protein